MVKCNDSKSDEPGAFPACSFALFTDVSLNPCLKCGVGVFMIIPSSLLTLLPSDIKKSDIEKNIKTKRFDSASSTKLEVQTVLWGIQYFQETLNVSSQKSLSIYCDSQCIAGLPGRRSRLEKDSFLSKGSKKLLNHANLYRRFYELQDQLKFDVIKVTGHSRSSSHDTVHRLFSFVDRWARKELRHLKLI